MKGRISIWFFDIMHYHATRLNSFKRLAEEHGYKVFIYSLMEGAPDRPAASYHNINKAGGQVSCYSLGEKSPELPNIGFQNSFSTNIEVLGSSRVPLNSLQTVAKLWSVLNRDNPEVVVIPGYRSWPCFAALGWCKLKSRLPILMSESHKRDFPRVWWKESLKRVIVKRFDAALVGGTPQFHYARELGLPPQRIFTGYDVVDNRFWQEKADTIRKQGINRRQAGLPERFFLTACRFISKKNISGLLQAYSHYRALAGAKAWDLVICGSGELEPKIRTEINTSGLERFVHLPGYKKAEEMTVFYGSASAFILPSSHAEQWGLVVNEAMASGLPVLVSEICGCVNDLVQNGVNGFTFDPFDVEGLALLMLKMSSGQVDLEAMGAASRRIIDKWTPEVFARSLLQAIEAARMKR